MTHDHDKLSLKLAMNTHSFFRLIDQSSIDMVTKYPNFGLSD